MTNVHVTRRTLQWFAGVVLALVVGGCSERLAPRAPIQMVKIETSPGGGAYSTTPPLALHSKIPTTSSANDLDNSGPKVAEPPKEKAKTEPRFAAPEEFVPLAKHSPVPVGGNLHGHER
jgi:hypothetical protein